MHCSSVVFAFALVVMMGMMMSGYCWTLVGLPQPWLTHPMLPPNLVDEQMMMMMVAQEAAEKSNTALNQ